MSAVLRSLCAVDGLLYIPTEKAILMHIIEAAKSEPPVLDLPPDDIADGAFRDWALVVDTMAVLQIMKKTATMRTLADFKEVKKTCLLVSMRVEYCLAATLNSL